jgi:hypothetical protein
MEPRTDRPQLEWLSRAISALLESPDVHEQILDTFRRDDPEAFGRTVTEHWRKYDLQPPKDQCYPYTNVYVFTLQPLTLVQRCWWVPPPGWTGANIEWTPPPPDEATLQSLIEQGLVQCRWDTVAPQAELKVAKKFVQGVCPPGTF